MHVGAISASPHSSRNSLDVRLDSAILGVYVVCFVIVLVLLPLGGSVDWTDALPALALQIIVGLLARLRPPAGP